MSVRLDRWFGVPPELIAGEFFEKMSPSDLALCVVLYWWSDRKSSRSFEVKDVEMETRTRLSRRSLLDARKHLAALGIVTISRTLGGHTYTLCDLKTGLPYPGDPKAKLNWLKKGANGETREPEAKTGPSVAKGNVVRAIEAGTQELDASWLERGAVSAFDIPSKRSLAPSAKMHDETFDYGFDTAFDYGVNQKGNVRS